MEEIIDKRVCYIGFWVTELQDLVEHLELSGYKDEELIKKMKESITKKES